MKNKIYSSIKLVYSLLTAALFTSMLLFNPSQASAQAVRHSSDFNHMSTGFPLTGVHTNVDCETCHVGGVFKGTPTACSGCHSPGRRVVATFKSANHIVTNAACETCHTNSVSFLGARFNHIGVQPKACATCHNGSMGPGKPAGHVVTVASCDTCHRSSSWIPAGFDHMSASPTVLNRCNQCHDGVQALGKYPLHIATPSPSCDSAGCHPATKYSTFAGLKYNHATAVPGQCGTCHSGQTVGAPTQTPGHIPYTGYGCNNCHVTPPAATTFNSPMPTMNHAAVAGLNCSRCHSGSYISQVGSLGLGALGKASKANHISTNAECNICHHLYTTFAGAIVDHSLLSPPATGRCKDCHDGPNATGLTKSSVSNHIPVTAQCDICHTGFTSFVSPLSTNTTQHTIGMPGIPCRTCHATGTNYLGVTGTKEAVSHKNADVGITGVDCSQSQCHRPTGTIGTSYIRFTN